MSKSSLWGHNPQFFFTINYLTCFHYEIKIFQIEKKITQQLKYLIRSKLSHRKWPRRFFEIPIDEKFYQFLKLKHRVGVTRYTDATKYLNTLKVPLKIMIEDGHQIEIAAFQLKWCAAKKIEQFRSLPSLRGSFT